MTATDTGPPKAWRAESACWKRLPAASNRLLFNTSFDSVLNTSFDTFLETAWNDHGDRPQEVADRLAASHHLVTAPDHIAPFARLLTHVYGEHLGQWQGGIEELESLRGSAAFDGGDNVIGALRRSIATLSYAAGNRTAIESLSTEDRVSVLAAVASAFAGRNRIGDAITAYSDALGHANAHLPASSPAVRALAIGGNNLASTLETKTRTPPETLAMVAAARAALKYWKQAGTWLEEERAHYRLARSLMQAGGALAAVQSAEECIAVCKRNSAPAFEQFFGYAALALALHIARDVHRFAPARTQALALLDQLPQEERRWCEADAAALAALSSSTT
jgi:hypothetical protein